MLVGEVTNTTLASLSPLLFVACSNWYGSIYLLSFRSMTRQELTVGTNNPPIDTLPKLYRFVRTQCGTHSMLHGLYVTIQIAMFVWKQRVINDLIIDVHGHQIFIDGCFNGDPHPGNILQLEDGTIGLIDYGQCKELNDDERLGLAKIITTLASSSSDQMGNNTCSSSKIVHAMEELGFCFKHGKEDVIIQMAYFCFDSDTAGKAIGCTTPQDYLTYLQSRDPMQNVPDAAVFVARTSFLFRGMGILLGQEIHTSQKWAKHAKDALLSAEDSRS